MDIFHFSGYLINEEQKSTCVKKKYNKILQTFIRKLTSQFYP